MKVCPLFLFLKNCFLRFWFGAKGNRHPLESSLKKKFSLVFEFLVNIYDLPFFGYSNDMKIKKKNESKKSVFFLIVDHIFTEKFD